MKISIAGAGYVGFSLAVLLSSRNEVEVVDVDQRKVDAICHGLSPIKDSGIESYLAKMPGRLHATSSPEEGYRDAELVIVAVPTNFDVELGFFDTACVEKAVEAVVSANPSATILIRSTVPVGYTESLQRKYANRTILFSPEFLRESKALYDGLHPSRIVVGRNGEDEEAVGAAQKFARLLKEASLEENVPFLFTKTSEAEAIKLFSNAYLALRVAYFNELDTYALTKGLDAKILINGVCLDPRIQSFYNNPSFGYGGYCLPKDTKQLLANYADVPQSLIGSIIESNKTRKEFIASEILRIVGFDPDSSTLPTIGIYRLTMKTNSDNFRDSSIQDVMKALQEKRIPILVYEPILKEQSFLGAEVVNDLAAFKTRSDLIVANRYSSELDEVKGKTFTRDVFFRD